jgi:hypothetical protein
MPPQRKDGHLVFSDDSQVPRVRTTALNRFLTLEQKVETLREEVGELKRHLQTFLKIQELELEAALVKARWIAEYVVNSVLQREELTARRDLLDNIEILGSKEEKPTRQRSGRPPILPPTIYAALHTGRIYGNLGSHPHEPGTTRRKEVRITDADTQVALATLLRIVEWFCTEYDNGLRLEPLYLAAPEPVPERGVEVPAPVSVFVGRESAS